MNQDQTVDTSVLEQINAVEGFDPRPFAVDYTDLGTGRASVLLYPLPML